MAATIAAARACARTLLCECLRIDAFRGATPHVMLVVDRHATVLQKVLIEGYRQTLEELNGTLVPGAEERARSGHLYVPLDPTVAVPCGASGLGLSASLQSDSSPKISFSIAPFEADSFMKDMQRLQSFLRLCGQDSGSDRGTGAAAAPSASPAEFERRFKEVARFLVPLSAEGSSPADAPPSEDELRRYAAALRDGHRRELLGFILIQRSAFQNELRQYRLRLALFGMGMRVAEHCHLESMSASADALAAAGNLPGAMEDDQVRTYAQSCAFPPMVTESLARAVADSIDLHAWQRGEETDARAPPPSYARCLGNERVWALLRPGSLKWHGDASPAVAERALCDAEYEALLQRPITGVGAPLRVVSNDDDVDGREEGAGPQHVLTFGGGLEDCLMNTGYYAAACQSERNDVNAHRRRFPDANAAAGDEEEDGEADGSGEAAREEGAAVRGRLKKKEYLAMLKARGKKPNKPAKVDKASVGRKARDADSDTDEQLENTRARACAASGERSEDGCAGARSGAKGEEGKAIAVSIGGTFPIGEVISESFDLSKLNGSCRVFAYPGLSKELTMSEPRPFVMTIEHGCVTAVSDDCPAEFVDLLSLVQQAEGGRCYVRELGIGLNPFTGRQHVLADVTSFERQWGIHLSLGQRHPLFVKQKARRNADGSVCEAVRVDGPVLKRKAGKYHIDVFVDAARLEMGSFALDFTKGVVTAP